MDVYELRMIQQENAIRDKKIALRESKLVKENELAIERENELCRKIHCRNNINEAYNKFKQDVTEAIVTESILCLTNSCIDSVILSNEYNKALSRQLVSNFVKQEGASRLLNRFKKSSYMLSEMAYVCEKHIKSILEGTNKDDKSSHKIDSKKKEDFFKDLDKVDADNAIATIRQRVKTSTEEFIDSNVKNRFDIEKTLKSTKDKVEKAKAEKKSKEIQENYIHNAKRKIADMKANKRQTVYEAMVYNLSRSAINNEQASKVFVENASLNMDRITEHCEVMYTFLTVLDTCKIVDVNEAYIAQVLEDMKK